MKPMIDITVEEILQRLDSYHISQQPLKDMTQMSAGPVGSLVDEIRQLQSFEELNSRYNVPPSHRPGVMKKVANLVLGKLLFAVRIFISGIVNSQEIFNQKTRKVLSLLDQKIDTNNSQSIVDVRGMKHDIEVVRKETRYVSKELEQLQITQSEFMERDSSPLNYLEFENRFRGQETTLYEDQKRYLPYLTGSTQVLDIGCGRGELLKLLRENGIGVKGIDIDRDMIEYCQKDGLDVELVDANTYLEKVKNSSLDGIIALQVVEHLHNKYLIEFIRLAYQKLKKGGCIILETPNPQNLGVFVNSFYLDLSHQKPVHPKTLGFILETEGFSSIETNYYSLAPSDTMLKHVPGGTAGSELLNQNVDKLNNVLFGYQDYAIIARK
ncbi:hypothetical protein AUK40_04095 [Candidatus Wirthbacteria bacterium CG2_30_54_11]|uniref:Methyltransferase type 11 domain-containing protein n=1 Tax=Candidatus Wirthbacteria bacterium CG2_30_54_11 TaxID=1817892 RepID=A0A1J5IRR2_9BACT|nr:MAG: hypothetical protein AUK40_04095 [Candidatus Wirthbacteria bacterium CG2_30_54_11]